MGLLTLLTGRELSAQGQVPGAPTGKELRVSWETQQAKSAQTPVNLVRLAPAGAQKQAPEKRICVAPCVPPPGQVEFTVRVNYGQSVEQSLQAGVYSWINSKINSQNFPEPQAKNYIEAAKQKGIVETKIEIISLNGDPLDENPYRATTPEALRELDRRGYRPANFYELLALGAQHRDLQRKDWIAGLGSSWGGPWGRRRVPGLGGLGAGRYLGLRWTDRDWGDDWRFAAVRKREL